MYWEMKQALREDHRAFRNCALFWLNGRMKLQQVPRAIKKACTDYSFGKPEGFL